MTQNQIRYLQLMEDSRANRAKEQENVRSNTARELETNRANLESERLAREKWDYEKYGKGGSDVGGVVRTIKAGVNDLTKVIDATGDAIKEAQSTKTPNETLGTKQNDQVDYGGLDVHKVASQAKTSSNPYLDKSLDELQTLLATKEKQLTNPSTAPRNIQSVTAAKDEIAQIKSAIDTKENKKKETNKKGMKKMGKLLGITDE